jgi:hypothetical protein
METIKRFFKKYWEYIICRPYRYIMVDKYFFLDDSPKKCTNCGCTVIDEIITNEINYITCECKLCCHNCKKELGYFAYGNYDPYYKEIYLKGL